MNVGMNVFLGYYGGVCGVIWCDKKWGFILGFGILVNL